MQLLSSLSTLVALAAVHVAAAPGVAPLVVNTPSDAVQCTPTTITWSGGQAPFSLLIQNSAGPILEVPNLEKDVFVWSTNVHSGEAVNVEITDDQGANAFTAFFEIQPSSDSSCL